ncbi:MAG: GNVR domain-containing protein [Bacillota bacterium]|nr:GNVR domain-containing protein [Bacillota bacterium]
MDQIEQEVDLLEYLRVLARRKWLIFAVVVTGALTAYMVSSRMTSIYQATATIMIRTDNAMGAMPFVEQMMNVSSNGIRNCMEFLKSRTVVESALARLGWYDSLSSEQVGYWQKSLSVQQVQGTDVARLSVESDSPEKAAAFLNTLIEVFKDYSQRMNQESARAAREFIAQQLAISEGALRRAEDALLQYKKSSRVVEPSAETRSQIEKIAAIEKDLAGAEVELGAARAERQEIERSLRSADPTLVTSTTLVNNPLVQQYRVRLSDLETELAGARERYTDNHPTVVSLKAQIAEVKAKLSQEVENVVGSQTRSLNPIHQELRTRLVENEARSVGLEAKQSALRQMLLDAEAKLAVTPQKEMDVARLVREQRVDEEIYVMLRTKYEEMRITEAMKVSDVYVVDRATVPDTPVKPRKPLNTAIAAFLGLFVAVGMAFVMEYMDTSFRTQDEVERLLDLPVLGVVPDIGRFRRRRSRRKRAEHAESAAL